MKSALHTRLGEIYKPRKKGTFELAIEKIDRVLECIPRMMIDSFEDLTKYWQEYKPYIAFAYFNNSEVDLLALEILKKQFADETIGFKTFPERDEKVKDTNGNWWFVNIEEMFAASDRVKAEDAIKKCNECGLPAIQIVKASWFSSDEDTYYCEEHSGINNEFGEKIEKTSSSE